MAQEGLLLQADGSRHPWLGPAGPELTLIAMIDDFKNYDAPVMLPNGDILIRRNAPMVPVPKFVPGPNGEIEL